MSDADGWKLRRTEPDPRDARVKELEAEVARLEALIVEAAGDDSMTEVYAAAQRIRSRT